MKNYNIINNGNSNFITNLCTSIRTHLLTLLCIYLLILQPSFAFEDVVISSTSKLSDIKIEYNDVINVYPLITLTNDKKILMIEPLKEGHSRFIVTKDKKEQAIFSVKVEAERTIVNAPDNFEVLPLDIPAEIYEYEFDLDEPPEIN